jgi:uncharacterized membrane protein
MTMRLAAKTATYAAMHLTVAIAVAYALTRNWHVALAVGIIEPIIQTFAFNLHERAWAKAPQALVSTAPPASSAAAA